LKPVGGEVTDDDRDVMDDELTKKNREKIKKDKCIVLPTYIFIKSKTV
jgi:hypothetical protein